jgi:hypothetical protein
VVLPLLRRYFLISRGFGYFVGSVLFASPSLRANVEKPIHERHSGFFTEGSEENEGCYLWSIQSPLRYLRFLL